MQSKIIVALSVAVGLLVGPVYAKKDHENGKQLPPGLQKKADNGKQLPPGWQKKLKKGETLDKKVYERSKVVVPLDSKGLVTISIEGKLVKLYKATREIVEVLE